MEAALDRRARFMVDDLLNFTLDAGDEDDDDENNNNQTLKPLSSSSSSLESSKQDPDDHQTLSLTVFMEKCLRPRICGVRMARMYSLTGKRILLPEFAEEELEWLSNKDAFPAVETCLDILSDNPGIVQSPASVLENSSTTSTSTSNSSANTVPSCCARSILVPVPPYPGKARSRRRRRRGFSDLPGQQWWSWSQEMVKSAQKGLPKGPPPPPPSSTIGRRCQHCQADKTPQWRAGPMGPKTLCNACGVRYKSGRLVPEYRPASSPTFSSVMHSNSHRKIIEMRRQRYGGGE